MEAFAASAPKHSWLRAAWRHLRANLPLVLLVSAAVLIPCFWQARIQAGDLSSHLYNAWLVNLVEHGKAPGLVIARQWTNVLTDYALAFLLRTAGTWTAEHVVMAAAVLIFFWGAFALVWTVNKRPPWSLTPILGILAYGWVFHAGFLNFYVSLGISLWLFAIAWHGYARDWLAIVPGLAVAYLAHPLPVVWMLGSIAYVYILRRLTSRARIVLLMISIGAIFCLRIFLVNHFQTIWSVRQILYATGADQAAVYGRRDLLGAGILLLLCAALLFGSREGRSAARGPLGHLYLLCAAGIALVPDMIKVSAIPGAWTSYLAERMSLISAVLACALLGGVRIRAWHRWTLAGVAVLFACSMFVNDRELNRIESEVTTLARALPEGSRVLFYLDWQAAGEHDPHFVYRIETEVENALGRIPFGAKALEILPRNRVPWDVTHMIDRACIAHCFSYANYEPSVGQFRVRAPAPNSVVTSEAIAFEAMETGQYVVRASDLPMYQIYRCGKPGEAQRIDLCVRELRAGEVNGSRACP